VAAAPFDAQEGTRDDQMLTLTASSTGWQVGLALGIAVVVVAAAIVIVIVLLAMKIVRQARAAEQAVEVVRRQTAELEGIARINDSGVRILHAARALRKVAVGK
jgi:flagellar biosynthesis/type III secretory pathway M-ring protein FliF/YscJ